MSTVATDAARVATVTLLVSDGELIDGTMRGGMGTGWIIRTRVSYAGHFTPTQHTVPALTDLPAALARQPQLLVLGLG